MKPASAAADARLEALAWEVEAARTLLERLHALGVKAALIALVDDVPLAVTQNARDLLPLCNRIVAAHEAPKDRTLN